MVFRLLAAAATMLALGAPVVDAFNCTCPNGTPTTGAGITGCEADGVDCSACNAGFYISAAAGTGSQKCTACALVGNANSAVTCTTGINSQVTACKDTHTLVQSATAAAADSCKEKGAETYCIKPEVAACNQCCSTKSSFCVKKKCWKCWGGSATTGSANCKACWSNKCMPECQVRSIDHCLPYVELHQVLHLHLCHVCNCSHATTTGLPLPLRRPLPPPPVLPLPSHCSQWLPVWWLSSNAEEPRLEN
eukprot:COSAG01_NODE_4641_length_4858_cov_6.174827_7_plen_249_part_00